MEKRYVSLWFPYLLTDWLLLRRPELKEESLVFVLPERGRKVITAINGKAAAQGIKTGIPLADAKALIPQIHATDEKPGHRQKLLKGLGEWCIRFTPVVAIDPSGGLFLDASGCTHLWGTESSYIEAIVNQLKARGYQVKGAMADTRGAAWAIARYAPHTPVVERNKQAEALLRLPPEALRLESLTVERLHKLGLRTISSFIRMPRSVLRRRFGEGLLLRLRQALGQETEYVEPLHPVEPYQERLPCLEPICMAKGIEIAIQTLLEMLCARLQGEGKGLRQAVLKCYCVDGRCQEQSIGTNKPSCSAAHLFKLFELKIAAIEPGLGIELFVLEALKAEDLPPEQEAFWKAGPALNNKEVAELLDRIGTKLGADKIHRYLPEEHYLPERSVRESTSITEPLTSDWRTDCWRPIELLKSPQPIEVTAPIPDYPPMLFRYLGKSYKIRKSDGPERIEQEWWIKEGEHRDYYQVEDENGQRYWLFRLGHYNPEKQKWFIHGYFV